MARRNNPEEEILQDEFLDEAANTSDEWMGDEEFEGQLAVDVYQTKDSVVVKAPIAGVRPDDIDIAISEDVMTIRGDRKKRLLLRRNTITYRNVSGVASVALSFCQRRPSPRRLRLHSRMAY